MIHRECNMYRALFLFCSVQLNGFLLEGIPLESQLVSREGFIAKGMIYIYIRFPICNKEWKISIPVFCNNECSKCHGQDLFSEIFFPEHKLICNANSRNESGNFVIKSSSIPRFHRFLSFVRFCYTNFSIGFHPIKYSDDAIRKVKATLKIFPNWLGRKILQPFVFNNERM